MSDRFEEAAKEYLQAPIYEWTTQEMIQEELERFARWYEEQQHKEMCAECEYKDKCDTLNSYNPGCLGFVDKHRGTCEFPSHIAYHNSWWEYCPVCGRRIKETK
jgi:hypothetical protein